MKFTKKVLGDYTDVLDKLALSIKSVEAKEKAQCLIYKNKVENWFKYRGFSDDTKEYKEKDNPERVIRIRVLKDDEKYFTLKNTDLGFYIYVYVLNTYVYGVINNDFIHKYLGEETFEMHWDNFTDKKMNKALKLIDHTIRGQLKELIKTAVYE